MRSFLSPFFILIVSTVYCYSQSYSSETVLFSIPLGGAIEIQSIKNDFFPSVQSLEMPSPQGTGHRSVLVRKKELLKRFNRNNRTNDTIVPLGGARSPFITAGFKGNSYNNRTPNDNDLSISNDGILLSVINSTIYMYDTEKDSFLHSVSLQAFSDTLGLPHTKFDPRTLYDPDEDRFIIVFLNGNLDTTSKIIVAFSQTNDPLGGWNLYALNGNPLNDSIWSDYPSIGISSDELFIGINTFTNGSQNNSGFVESVIWQIDKFRGYDGLSLTTDYHHKMNFNQKPFFNICPMQGGSGLYGPNMYFLSNNSLSKEGDTLLFSDTVYLIQIDNNIANNGQFSAQLLISPIKYGLPPHARQANDNIFDTNDPRILCGFYEDGEIQFVLNTHVPVTGFSGIFHGFITGLGGNPALDANILGDTLVDLGYPSIAYSGKNTGDNDAIITVNHTAPNVFSGFSVIYYSNEKEYSDLVYLKDGIIWVNIIQGKYERWGDYSGSQRKYNEPGSVWAVGSWGSSGVNQTWISKIERPYGVGIPPVLQNENLSGIFPNPASELINIQLLIHEPGQYSIRVSGINGQLIENLVTVNLGKGQHQFNCSLQSLKTGFYFIEIRNSLGSLHSAHKIIKY